MPGSAGNGPAGDPDGDGILNSMEFLMGLDPNAVDRGAFPRLWISRNERGGIRIVFTSIPDRHYRISWSSDLANWTALEEVVDTGADVLPGTYEIMDDDLPDVGKRFYRLEVALP